MKALLPLFILVTAIEARAFIPTEAYTFEFNIKTVRMTRLKEHKLYRAVEILRQVFASPEFKERILRHEFRGRPAFHLNRGLSNREIYEQILHGVERLHPYRNNAMDVEIELYADFESRVLGYTYPRSRRIWMNTKYFNRHSPAEVAGHLTHEWLHKLGYDHERKRTPARRFSVPYAVGNLVKDLGRQYE
jgi:hypothetical protein